MLAYRKYKGTVDSVGRTSEKKTRQLGLLVLTHFLDDFSLTSNIGP
jgi:hypothetical protein